jgi:hypothetical protein
MPYEDVPASPAAEKARAETSSALAGGYSEISEPEYLWLLKATDCPPEVMPEPPIFLKEIRSPAATRYFICASCSYRSRITDQLVTLVEDYRGGKREVQSSGGTAFFGRGGTAPPRLCVDGRVSE